LTTVDALEDGSQNAAVSVV